MARKRRSNEDTVEDFIPEWEEAPSRTPKEEGPGENAIDEAAALGENGFGAVLWVDARLSAAGLPQMSPWWRDTLRAFYDSGKRWLIVRAGRGGGKSTTLIRVALADILFTHRVIPPGQRWIWPYISASTPDAAKSVSQMEEMLRILNLGPYNASKAQGRAGVELTDLHGNAVEIRSMAGTVTSLSGPSSIGATVDEEAKLRDDTARHVNPASEILATLVQTFRARPGIRAIRCSSAWQKQGSHYSAIEEGDTESSFVARLGLYRLQAVQGLLEVATWSHQKGDAKGAKDILEYAMTVKEDSPNIPTWVANPTISALASRKEVEACVATEGLTRTQYWLRENASVPMAVGAEASKPRASVEGLVERMREHLRIPTDPRDPRKRLVQCPF